MVFILFSCQSEPVPVSSVTLDKQSQMLVPGEKFVLKAVVSPDNADNKKVIWSVSNSSVELTENIDGTASVTGVSVGSAEVIVKTDDGAFEDRCVVTIGASVEKIELDQTFLSLKKGESVVLKATVSPADASNQLITWGTSDPEVATVTQDGKVVAVGGGKASVYASTVDGGFVATCEVVVSVPIQSLSLTPDTKEDLYVGQSFVPELTVMPADAIADGLKWSSSDPNVAEVLSNGTVTAKGPGSAKITVTTSDGKISATCQLTVNLSANHVHLSSESLELVEGESAGLTATIYPENSTDRTVEWKSVDNSVATVTSDGTVTAVKSGQTKIIASVSESVFAECVVTVSKPVEGVTVTPATLVLSPGEQSQLSASVLPETASDKGVTWFSDDEAVAVVNTSGVVKAVAPGAVNIHARSNDGGKIGTCKLVVRVPVTGITLSKQSVVAYVDDGNFTLTATVKPDDATDKTLVWESSDPEVLKVAGVNGTAVTLTPLKPSDKSVNLKVYSKEYPDVTATCLVTVSQHVKTVTLDKSSLSLYVGDSYSLACTVGPEDATDKTVTWKSSNTKVATVDASGKVKAVGLGDAVVTVTTKDQSKTAECKVSVIAPVEKVTLDKTTLSVAIGQKSQIKATVLPETLTEKGVTWTSSNTSVATVDADGYVTGVALGNVDITAKSKADPTKSAVCKVTVINASKPITAIEITPTELTLTVGQNYAMRLKITPSDATGEIEWLSNKPAVASVDASGNVTALGIGDAKIVARSGDVIATCVLHVVGKNDVTSVKFDNTSLTLEVGGSETLVATVGPDDASDKSLTWTSSNSAVAKVDANGKVTGVSGGTATIKATAKSGVSATCTVTVVEEIIPVTKITLSTKRLDLALNQTEVLVATVEPANATEQLQFNVGISCPIKEYSVDHEPGSNKWYITLTANNKEGEGNFAVRSEAYKASCTISAKAVAVSSVTLDKHQSALKVGESLALNATINPSNASNQNLKWTSSDNTIATVSQTGLVTAKKAGKVTIMVASLDGNRTDRCEILVRPNVVPGGEGEGVGFDDWN